VINDRKTIWFGWAVGIFLIVLSRLPHLSGASAVLDGDEAILALMGKHLSEGRPLELFFYGQNFGVTVVENINAALFFLLLGVSTTSLKIATLALWVVGWSFFLFGTRRLTNTVTALIAGFLLLGCSAWGIWSTLARGYHVGGFMLCQFCYWQFANLYKSDALPGTRLLRFGLLGASAALLFLTQKIWFISFLPFLAILLWQRKNQREALLLIAPGVIFAALPQLLNENSSQYWNPEYLKDVNPILALTLTPERIWTFFGGTYSYSVGMGASLLTNIAALIWCLIAFLSFIFLAKRLRTGPQRALFGAIIASSLVVIGTTLFVSIPLFGYRYLLPLASLSCLIVALCGVDQPKRWRDFGQNQSLLAITVITVSLVVSGLLAIITVDNFRAPASFKPTELSPQESLAYLVEDLEAQDIHHVYSLDPMLQWNIIFSSQENIIARWSDPRDRLPEYPLQVDQTLFAGGNVAIVGTAETLESFAEFLRSKNRGTLPIYMAGDRYFWSPNPDQDLLETIGFELNEVLPEKESH
jgi:hypothetical protein